MPPRMNDNHKRAIKRGMNLLMTRDRTEADVRRKLEADEYPEDAIDAAIEYLISYKYIDDNRYACEYIRFKSASMSRKQIAKKLTDKGVDKNVIEEAFDTYEAEWGEEAVEAERTLIRKLICKRCPDGVSGLDYAAKQKLFAYLYGKGFSISDIESVYSQML